ncbi:acylphosphatase [Natribacillus halophilus]|uniref:acylphosphatase n=1 Tax=Natribacillus halophilus TaxID=549003 RepID=A0A1G8SDL9_9BACI|nr:acylphosphatase [Natribacillus halophilus]SDJ27346.1 D-alanine-D-alanine ligase [Natribacillus halophilus]
MTNEHEWLPHLEDAIPKSAYGKKLSMYTIALEAWRRGIAVKFYRVEDPEENKSRIRYSLSYQGREHKFESSRGDLLTQEAYDVCDDKDLTKQYLSKAGIPVPEGRRFTEDAADEEIVDYTQTLGDPVVLKPISENGGKGVFADIRDAEDMRKALIHVRQELNYRDVIVEKHVTGEEFRIFIVGHEIIGAVNRTPAHIVGDGISSIGELIDKKNKEKRGNPNLFKSAIEIDKELLNTIQSKNYTLNSIPESGHRIFLRNKSSVSMGGDPNDVTNRVTSQMKDLATKSYKSIPGLDLCGLDMIVDEENDSGTIIEVNTKPMLGLHLFPVKGSARDVTAPIIDYYFPETIDMEKTNLYFDFDSVLEPLKSRSTDMVEVTSPPLGRLYTQRYIVSGRVQGVGYRKWIRKQALQHQLHGYTKNKKDGKVVVVVAGSNESDVRAFKDICAQGPEKAQVEKVKAKEWEKPVKMGFEIKKESSSKKRLKELEKQLQKEKNDKKKIARERSALDQEKKATKQKLKALEEEKESLQQEYMALRNSRVWRYTRPLRNISSMTKRS